MEPEHVNQTPSHDFPLAAARRDLCDGPGGLDYIRQELLAERSQAERADQGWLASRCRFSVRLRSRNVTRGARDHQRRRLGAALSGRPEGSLISEWAQKDCSIAARAPFASVALT